MSNESKRIPRTGRAARIRAAAKRLGEFSADDLAWAADPATYRERRLIKRDMLDFVKRGEIVRLGQGRYRYAGRKRRRTYMDIVWHLVRSHRRFTLSGIERLSGASRKTVKEYIYCFRDLGYVEKVRRGVWRLAKDPGPRTPANTAKCARLKELRRKKGARHEVC